MGFHNKLTDKSIARLSEDLPEICRQSSLTERRAEEAERETEALKKTQYMAKRLGERFDGVISGVTSFGIFVELPNTVEGMVAFADLEGDTYVYDSDFMRITGERTKRTYNLGDKVSVIVARADIDARKVGFVFVNKII
jgi:ribonuclease R